MTHFELTKESKCTAFDVTLFRIRLTKDCKWGKAGDLGGWIEKKENLTDNAWISDNALVFGNAHICCNAKISGNAFVYGYALVCDNACVSDNSQVYGYTCVSGNAKISGFAQIFNYARISENAQISESAQISGFARISGNAKILGDTRIVGYSTISDDIWKTSPLQIQGTRHTVSECKKGYLQIGCKCYSLEDWEHHYETIGKLQNYSEKEILEYKAYIDLAIKLNNIRNK